jgi:hypothetical protein
MCIDAKRTGTLARNVFTQSQIRWNFMYLQTIQIDGTDETVSAVLQKWMEHLVPQLCSMLKDMDILL